MLASGGTIASTLFEENTARDSTTVVRAGALVAISGYSTGTTIEVKGCWFVRNEAVNGVRLTGGGAIMVARGAFLRVSETTFEANSVTSFGEACGGAIAVEGSLVLEGGVAFRANVVFGNFRVVGGAISVTTAASLNSSRLPGPVFLGNKVQHACFVVCPQGLLRRWKWSSARTCAAGSRGQCDGRRSVFRSS